MLLSLTLWLGPRVASADIPSEEIPLPADATVSPQSELPPELAAFAGAWGNDSWGGNLPTMLVVESIAADGRAHFVYAWGDSTDGKIGAGWRRMDGRIADDRLSASTSPGAAGLDYQRLTDGTLLGRYGSGGMVSYVRLKPIHGTDPATIKANAQAVRCLWTELQIPETSSVGENTGRHLILQAMLYRSPDAERRPLVIFSHGSTGGGEIKPEYFPRIMDGAIQRIFLSLGFNVVQPLRKGFGKSDGPLVEEPLGHGAQEGQLNSALEDLDATVAYMARQPYVDPHRIILVGQSRGGILSVAYAGIHPAQIIGVINFAGGWWGERMPTREFNIEQFSKAGRSAKVPMLWMYAMNDSYYSSNFIQRCFDAFQEQGGKARLVEIPKVPGDGHLLVNWPELWQPAVAEYLSRLGLEPKRVVQP